MAGGVLGGSGCGTSTCSASIAMCSRDSRRPLPRGIDTLGFLLGGGVPPLSAWRFLLFLGETIETEMKDFGQKGGARTTRERV